MKSPFLITATLIVLLLFNPPLHAQPVCKLELMPQLPDVTITSVTQETQFAPHCKVAGVIGSEIHFELLLPEKWNGKFVMGGGGGFVGSVVNVAASLYGAVQSGYATVGTDTGHQAHSLDASWALNNMERIVNFGHQAVHRTAVTAKALIKAYYQKDIARNYFIGCSRGGGQALMEAQRYPEDFEGIVAGAPAYNWTMGLGATMTQNMRAMYPDPNNLQEAIVGPKEQALIEASYLAMCDEQDGIKDGILNDPRDCKFDVATLLCKGEKTDSCLGQAQLNAVKTYYEGPKDLKGNPLYYGFPFGGETGEGGWSMWVTGGLKYQEDLDDFQAGLGSDFPAPRTPNGMYAFGNNVMKYLIYHDPDWTYTNYNYDNLREDAKLAANTLNATNPDLSAFRKRGGKLLMFTGWSDAGITALGTIGYYEEVIAHDNTAANDVRLFMMPGVEHCFGGPGPSWVNFLDVMDKWIETGNAPEQIPAYWLDEKHHPTDSRLLCAYPQVAKYDGKGDTRDVSSFSCVKGD
ncbi:MAG: tannase/feruloyl esterase family alpha/beta hydrolase [Deltaproteobacteria bacterium]|nr:tannase/feruloyl esterase family alpha/beta hydrolase [Deltaproteobacteria bacterium]